MKALVLALSFAFTFVVLAQENKAYSTSIIYDTQGTASVTNYVGFAQQNNANEVSTNDANWKIIQTVLDASGNEVTVKHAYNTNYTDSRALWGTAWTNRANATYK